MADELGDYLDQVLIGGREHRLLVIVDYDPAWPEWFRQERDRIKGALGAVARCVAHIGSTAVPGLAAKPIIDVLVTVDDVEHEETYRPRLEHVGYELRVREPGHRMFRTRARDVHVHVWPVASEEVRRHLLLWDWLRYSAHDRALYERVKHDLVRRDWQDMNYYADAKSRVIAEIMTRAEQWQTGGGATR